MVLGPDSPRELFRRCQLSDQSELLESKLPARFTRQGVYKVEAELFDLPEDRMTIREIRREYQLRSLDQPRWEHALFFCERYPEVQERQAWIPLLRKAECVTYGVSDLLCIPCFTTRSRGGMTSSQRVAELHPLDMVYGQSYLFLGIRSDQRIVVNPFP